jgi:hypothetical protein
MPLPVTDVATLRSLARSLADMEGSDFVSDVELDLYLKLGIQELYDLFAEAHGHEFFLKTVQIPIRHPINCYDLPDDFHMLKGVDFKDGPFPEPRIPLTGVPATTHWVMPYEVDQVEAIRPYTFMDRHKSAGVPLHKEHRGMRFRVFTEQQQLTSEPRNECPELPTSPEYELEFLSQAEVLEGVYDVTFYAGELDPEEVRPGMCAYLFGTVVGTVTEVDAEGFTVTVRTETDFEADGGGGDPPPPGDNPPDVEFQPLLFRFGFPEEVPSSPGCPYYKHRIRINPVRDGYLLVWYVPMHPMLAEGDDQTCPSGLVGFHGYEFYPAVFAATRMLTKEESDSSGLRADLEAMKTRIRAMAGMRDGGHPGMVQDFGL